MFLSQSYYGTPKIIRQNINYLVVLKFSGTRDINSILRECSVDLTKTNYQKCIKMRHVKSSMSLLLIWIKAVMKGIGGISLFTMLQNKYKLIKNNNWDIKQEYIL